MFQSPFSASLFAFRQTAFRYVDLRILPALLFLTYPFSSFSEEPAKPSAPFTVNPTLFTKHGNTFPAHKSPDNVQHFTVFEGVQTQAGYNHGAVLTGFKGQLFCQWQTSGKDEDGPGTHVIYSVSEDGEHWNKSRMLAPAREHAIVTSGGWWTQGDTLIAFINVWPDDAPQKQGHTEYATSSDGINWSAFKPVTGAGGRPVQGIIEQDLKALPSGRILTAFHMQPGLHATPYYTEDPSATSGWTAGSFTPLPHKDTISRELEPSSFVDADNNIVMTFRDQAGSFRVLASVSKDNGDTWSLPAVTGMPDSRAKQSAGNLPDGTAYLVNNPSGTKDRLPLVVTLSRDGKHFDHALFARDESTLPPMKFAGKYKRTGYSYPKSIVWRDALWISYAVNKEDIAVTRIPVSSLRIQDSLETNPD